MKTQTCCFTGHRSIPAKELSAIQKRLESEIVNLIHQGVTEFNAGGALGFDTMAALTVLKLKHEFPRIRLILVLPCKEQEKRWSEKDKKIYNQIREQSDKIAYTSEYYYVGCMHTRNRRLVENSEYCICFLTQNSGGTKYTIDYAIRKGLKIILLPDKEQQSRQWE